MAVIVLVTIANPWLLLPTLLMAAISYGWRYVYIHTSRCVKRLESLSKWTRIIQGRTC